MSLLWNPIIENLRSQASNNNSLTACISAYMTSEAVLELLKVIVSKEAYFIARWKVADLANGSSDLRVYEILQQEGIRFYINPNLHSKIYQFSDGSMICGSGNATSNGLGLHASQNIETASLVASTTLIDEKHLRSLCDSSLLVDDSVYSAFCNAVSEVDPNAETSDAAMDIFELYKNKKEFLLSDLPATPEPEEFIKTLSALNDLSCLPEPMRIDCVSYGIDCLMPEPEILETLSSTFCSSPFVMMIVEKIRQEGSMRFGAVSTTIHDHCEDVPAPCRRDVKQRVNTLYNWLCFFFDDLTWDIPGGRSQVIRSRPKT